MSFTEASTSCEDDAYVFPQEEDGTSCQVIGTGSASTELVLSLEQELGGNIENAIEGIR